MFSQRLRIICGSLGELVIFSLSPGLSALWRWTHVIEKWGEWVTGERECVDRSVHVALWGNQCPSPASYRKAIFIKHIKAKVYIHSADKGKNIKILKTNSTVHNCKTHCEKLTATCCLSCASALQSLFVVIVTVKDKSRRGRGVSWFMIWVLIYTLFYVTVRNFSLVEGGRESVYFSTFTKSFMKVCLKKWKIRCCPEYSCLFGPCSEGKVCELGDRTAIQKYTRISVTKGLLRGSFLAS